MSKRDGAPMTTNVRDGGHPSKRSIFERTSSLWRGVAAGAGAGVLEDVRSRGKLLVEEEDLAQDLGWDATGGGEGVAAGTDRAQRATDGGHLSIDEVESCRVCKGGGKDLLQDVVDEGNAGQHPSRIFETLIPWL
jgi:hypothetical protein